MLEAEFDHIWKRQPLLTELNSSFENSIHQSLGIVFTDVGPNYIEARMPVDPRTHQFVGYLHGGASVVLAESLGSIASFFVTNDLVNVFGVEVNCSHLMAVQNGFVVGRAYPIRLGKKLHVWEIDIRQEGSNRLVSKTRLTTYVTPRTA